MNQQKIKELKEQSYIQEFEYVDNWGCAPYYVDVFSEEKFAELILEECYGIISEVYREMPLEICGWMLHLEEKIKERFYNEQSNN